MNFDSLARDQIVIRISRAALQVYEKFGELSFLAVFNSLHAKQVRQFLQNAAEEDLPFSGQIVNNQTKQLILFEGLLCKKEVWETAIKVNIDKSEKYSLE